MTLFLDFIPLDWKCAEVWYEHAGTADVKVSSALMSECETSCWSFMT